MTIFNEGITETSNIVLVIILVVVILLILTNQFLLFIESRRYRPIGRMINTKNGKLHVYTRKSKIENSPTYVFLNAMGGGSSYFDFKMIWEPLTKQQASIVTIDYLGYGMSENTKAERTLDNIVEEIETVLYKLDLPEPYIFITHSLGGFYVTGFALKNPEKITALIMIDNTPPEIPLVDSTDFEMMKKLRFPFRFLQFTGLIRLKRQNNVPWLTKKEAKAFIYFSNKKRFSNTIMDEVKRTPENARLLINKIVSDNIPIFMLLSNKTEAMSDKSWKQTWVDFHKMNLNNHEKSRLEMLNTSHYIHWDDPDAVLIKITDFISTIQSPMSIN